MAERPEGTTVIAGAGSNDTRHAVHLTERACALGVDAHPVGHPVLQPAQPARDRRPLRGGRAATDRPIVLYNIPQRTASDMPNDLLAELAQLDHIEGVKQANNDNLALVDGLDLYAGNDDILARTLDLGGAGGILVASHVVGDEMRRMVDEPEERAEIDDEPAAGVYAALGVATSADPDQGRAEPARPSASGGLRLPLRRGRRGRDADDPRDARRAAGCWLPELHA